MSSWELRRLALVIGGLDLVALAIAVLGSVFVGGVSGPSIGLWAMGIALVMMFFAGGSGSSITLGRVDFSDHWAMKTANEMLDEGMNSNRQEDMRRSLQMSWTTAIALAGIPLLIVGGALTLL